MFGTDPEMGNSYFIIVEDKHVYKVYLVFASTSYSTRNALEGLILVLEKMVKERVCEIYAFWLSISQNLSNCLQYLYDLQ